jgi:hypothetical protein
MSTPDIAGGSDPEDRLFQLGVLGENLAGGQTGSGGCRASRKLRRLFWEFIIGLCLRGFRLSLVVARRPQVSEESSLIWAVWELFVGEDLDSQVARPSICGQWRPS